MARAGNIIKACIIFGGLLCNTAGVFAQGGWGRSGAADSSRVEHSAAVTKWLSHRALPLRSIEAGQSFEDLKPLKQVLRNVRLVGLGEGTHGTREFFQLKHRMVEFLVKEMGFTVLAMEVSQPAALDINEYVLRGTGDGKRALANQGLWAYDTNEITALIEWMRSYNETVPEEKKVKFVGFDMHNNEQAMDVVLSYLQRVAPERLTELRGVFQLFRATSLGKQHFEYIANVGAAEMARVQATLNELLGFLYLNEKRFSRLTSAAEFEQTMRHARTLAQFTDIYRRPPFDEKNPANSSGYTRDFYMAENIERIVAAEKPGTRVIAWAHNEHIGVGVYANNMGEYLRQTYGAGYYALGTTFNEGSFQARLLSPTVTIGELREFTLLAAPEGSLEWYFAHTGLKNFLIDLRSPEKDEAISKWLTSPRPVRSIGLGFAPRTGDPLTSINLRQTFDGFAFIEKTTRARPNPTGGRGAWNIPAKH